MRKNKKVPQIGDKYIFKGHELITGDILVLSAKSILPYRDMQVAFIRINDKGQLCVFDDFDLENTLHHSGVFDPEDVIRFSIQEHGQEAFNNHAYYFDYGERVVVRSAGEITNSGKAIAVCGERVAIASPKFEDGFITVGTQFVFTS